MYFSLKNFDQLNEMQHFVRGTVRIKLWHLAWSQRLVSGPPRRTWYLAVTHDSHLFSGHSIWRFRSPSDSVRRSFARVHSLWYEPYSDVKLMRSNSEGLSRLRVVMGRKDDYR